jgi:hypothetical protein
MHSLLQGLAATAQGGPANHILLVGPRGIGKTHVLALLDHYTSGRLTPPDDSKGALAGWVPIFFSEEEFAGQNSLANFLLTAMHKLGEAQPQEVLWKLPADLPAQGDAAITECCFDRLRRFHAERGRRLLLLVDNLQRILPQWPSDDHDSLRAFLSGQGFVLLVGTAPSVFKDVLDQRAAFHQFFDIQVLPDLSEGEMLELLRRLYREDGREADFEARREELSRKLPAFLSLTGGNPRLVLFLYQVATRSTFLEIESALSELLDGLHDYFLQRFERLPDQPRKILDTIAQMPGPATPTEIAQAARLPVAIINAQIRHLKADHYVQIVKFKRQRATRYDITERLFRIWRQTATVAGRRRFRFLTDFLKLYFTPEEVRSLYLQHAAFIGPDLAGDREAILRHIEELFYLQSAADGATRREIFATRIAGLLRLGETHWAEDEADHLASASVTDADKAGSVTAYAAKADVHIESERYEEACDDLVSLEDLGGCEEAMKGAEKLVGRWPKARRGWLRLASSALLVGQWARSLDALRKAEELGDPSEPICTAEAEVLCAMGRYDEALTCARRAIELDQNEPGAWEALGHVVAEVGDDAQALDALSKAAELGKPTAELEASRAAAHNRLGQHSEALTCAEQAIAMNPDEAMAWEEAGFASACLGNLEGALNAFRRAAQLGRRATSLSLFQGLALGCLGHRSEGIAGIAEALSVLPPCAVAIETITFWALRLFADHAKLLAEVNTALSQNKNLASLYLARAFVLADRGPIEPAIASVELARQSGASLNDLQLAQADILLVGGRYDEALTVSAQELAGGEDDWLISSRHQLAKACLGQQGPHMEALPAELLRAGIPQQMTSDVSDFLLRLAERALERGEANVTLGLLNALSSIASWRLRDWFGEGVGAFLQRVLQTRPQEFLAAVEIVRQNVTEEDVLRLLDPFLQAAEFVRARDLTLLERLFPEVRGLVLDIVHRVAPELDDLVRPAR